MTVMHEEQLECHPSRDHEGPWELTRYWNGYRDPGDPDDWQRLVWSWEAVKETLDELDPHDDPAISVFIVKVELEPVA